MNGRTEGTFCSLAYSNAGEILSRARTDRELESNVQSGDTHLMNVSEQQTIANEEPFVRWQRSSRGQIVEYQI